MTEEVEVGHAGEYSADSPAELQDKIRRLKATVGEGGFIATFKPASDIATNKDKCTLACYRCGEPNSVTPFGYYCCLCMADIGIGSEKNNYKHGYV